MAIKKSSGHVYLVGSGPGDPGLLTLRAKRRIESADIIIYDYLANPEHLRHAKRSAKLICVGKGFRYRKLSQEKINKLIIRSARSGQNVVRLKGGDPYLFGRGGEEALYLFERKIPFEVVPGVTSATACAAYAGIPLTHRDHNASVTFLTGHRADDDRLDSIDWKKIAALQGTLAIYMGVYNLRRITERLIANGMPSVTKIAVIEWGTLPRQRSCVGTLQNISDLVERKSLKAPCMIIVGEVVSLRKKLSWFEDLPLFGKKIVITRMLEKSASLREKLAELGAEVLEFPTIEIHPAENYSQIDAAIQRISRYHWIVFTSPYGVDAFLERLKNKHKKDGRWLGRVKIASVGPQTTRALQDQGLRADLEPKRFETSAIAEEFKKRFSRLSGVNILLPRTDIAPKELETALKKLGANTFRVTAYRTKTPRTVPDSVRDAFAKNTVDYVTFTSSSTVEHFVKLLGIKKVRSLAKKSKFISIGPVTSKTLERYGLKVCRQAKTFTPDGLVDTLLREAGK